MAHGNVDEARSALDAALAIDSQNVQALDWRAELDRQPAAVPPPAPAAPAAAVAGGWAAFEGRVRERRILRRSEAARAALATGDHAAAREALEELAVLAPGNPDVLALQRDFARTKGDSIQAPPPALVPPLNRHDGPAAVRPQVRESPQPRQTSHAIKPAAAVDQLTLTPPAARSRWVPLAAAAVVLAGIGGVLGFNAVNRRDTASINPAPVASQQTAESAPGPVTPDGPTSVDVPEAVAPAPLSATEAVSTAGEASGEDEITEGSSTEARIDPIQAASATDRSASSRSPAAAVEDRRPLTPEPTRTSLPSREYPGSTIEMSAPTQLASARPTQPPVPAVAEGSATALTEAIGTTAAEEDSSLVASTMPAASSSAALPAGSTPSSTAVPSPTASRVTPPPPRRVDPAAAAEASVRQLLDRYVRAYNRLDAAAAHAVWPAVNKTALERAFAELSAQTLRFERCAVAVDEEGGTATCSGDARWVPRVGGQGPKREQRTWRFELARNGDDWFIARAEARR
jgi:hypothetical protein